MFNRLINWRLYPFLSFRASRWYIRRFHLFYRSNEIIWTYTPWSTGHWEDGKLTGWIIWVYVLSSTAVPSVGIGGVGLAVLSFSAWLVLPDSSLNWERNSSKLRSLVRNSSRVNSDKYKWIIWESMHRWKNHFVFLDVFEVKWSEKILSQLYSFSWSQLISHKDQ